MSYSYRHHVLFVVNVVILPKHSVLLLQKRNVPVNSSTMSCLYKAHCLVLAERTISYFCKHAMSHLCRCTMDYPHRSTMTLTYGTTMGYVGGRVSGLGRRGRNLQRRAHRAGERLEPR